MLTRATPAVLLALLVVLILGIVACSSPQPAGETKPPPQEETETGDRDNDSEAPESDPVDEDTDDDQPPVGDGDTNHPDDEDDPADDDDDTTGPPEDEEDDAGTPDDDETGPTVEVSNLRTVLRAHTALNDAGVGETALILTANIEFTEAAKEATQLAVTLLTGDGSVSGSPYLLDIAAGESSVALTADGHDWGLLAHESYRVSVASAGEPTVNEHDLSWLPGGLSLPSDLEITMTSPTEMSITFEPAAEARIHHVTASYTSADETRKRGAMGNGEATISSGGNFEVLLGREYQMSVMAEIAESEGDHGVTRFTSETVATLKLGQLPEITAWVGPSTVGPSTLKLSDGLDTEGSFGRLFVMMPAGIEEDAEIEVRLSWDDDQIPLPLLGPVDDGFTRSWLMQQFDAGIDGPAVLTVTVEGAGDTMTAYEADFDFATAGSPLDATRPDTSNLNQNDMFLSWEPVAEATHYLLHILDITSTGPEPPIVFSSITTSSSVKIPFSDDFRITVRNRADFVVMVHALDSDPNDPTERIVRSSAYVDWLNAYFPIAPLD